MRHQNKISKYRIGVILVTVKKSGIKELVKKLDAIKNALKIIKPGQLIVVSETESKS